MKNTHINIEKQLDAQLITLVNGSLVTLRKPPNNHLKAQNQHSFLFSPTLSHSCVRTTLLCFFFFFLQPLTHSLVAFPSLLSRANRSNSTSVPSPLVQAVWPQFSNHLKGHQSNPRQWIEWEKLGQTPTTLIYQSDLRLHHSWNDLFCKGYEYK